MAGAAWQKKISIVKQFQFKWILIIALSWTFIDVLRFMVYSHMGRRGEYTFIQTAFPAVMLQFILVFLFSLFMGYLIVLRFKKYFRKLPLWAGILLKTAVLYFIELLLYSILFFLVYHFIYKLSFADCYQEYRSYFFYSHYLLNNTGTWILLFIITQLIVEINEKYSPGLFRDILAGKYIEPKEEKKIIMFIDLKNSTAIAEQLGHKKYFSFIKDFVYHISKAVLTWDGDIYQYVGDEVVVSWPATEINYNKSINALLEVRRQLQKNNDHYRTTYALIPDFRAGLHTGNVMVGEIGIIKKDLAMSGDSMNTTARIKNMVTDLNKRFIASWDYVEAAGLQAFQLESAGVIDLKGKEKGIELFILQL